MGLSLASYRQGEAAAAAEAAAHKKALKVIGHSPRAALLMLLSPRGASIRLSSPRLAATDSPPIEPYS